MEGYEDEDDTHYCNKCHATINGLENYVRHRKSGCRTFEEEKPAYHCPPTPSVSYPEILNADAFFSSLELQSSAKSQPRPATEALLPRRSGRHEALRKRSRKDKSPEDKEELPKEKLPNLLPVDADLDDLGIPSLVGFPPEELVPAAKPGSSSKPASKSEAGPGKAAELPQQQRPAGQPAEESEHRQADDWLDDYNELEGHEAKELRQLSRYDAYDYQPDDETEDDSSDGQLVVDDESYSESEDPDAQQDDPQYPPRTHTGGKWRPGAPIAQDNELGHEDEPEPEEQPQPAQQHQQDQEHPPPSYTGGKWRPADSSTLQEDYEGGKESGTQPPPGHTRGKWVPGARADAGNSGIWCSPCGRKLASQLVYNRHLRSELHARRSIREIDDAVRLPRIAQLPQLRLPALSHRQKVLALKKTKLTKSSCSAASTSTGRSSGRNGAQGKQELGKRRRNREKEVLSCDICRARVRRAQMGKHLLSHYHCRVAGAIGPSASGQQDRFIIDNMPNIVRQCPFQCAPCRFYCNTESTFLRHWTSRNHRDTVAKIDGKFICALCDFWCDDNEGMEAHLMNQGHRDVVSMINGSVPMVIRRQRILTCPTCCRRFRYNMELRVHSEETGHRLPESATDDYQSRMICSACGHVCRSRIAVQRHQLACHRDTRSSTSNDEPPSRIYFCSYCSMNFATREEGILHRRTSAHKERVSKAKRPHVSHQRTCPHCPAVHDSIAEHKQHIIQSHPSLCYRCSKCGDKFALSQEVTVHTREGKCTARMRPASEMTYKCTLCSYGCESNVELLYHRSTLHEPGTSKGYYKCPICGIPFDKANLRAHICVHTGERPYHCANCNAAFSRRGLMKQHMLRCTGQLTDYDATANEETRQRRFVCDECGSAFFTKHILRQHILRHGGKIYKCGMPGCPTVLRTKNELNKHREICHAESNSTNREFQCNDCTYASKTKSQLVRHMKLHDDSNAREFSCNFPGCQFKSKSRSHIKRHSVLHTGQKPYKCRLCPYASNLLDNLRKHVLSTNKHPGTMIYQCRSCKSDKPFETNFSKELRAHLLEAHPNEYPTPNDASNYVANIFK